MVLVLVLAAAWRLAGAARWLLAVLPLCSAAAAAGGARAAAAAAVPAGC